MGAILPYLSQKSPSFRMEGIQKKSHSYSILTGLGKVEFLVHCVLMDFRQKIEL